MHNLAVINGQEAFAYQNAAPWHGLGKRAPHGTSIAEMMQLARLDWTVRLEAMILKSDGRDVATQAAVRNGDNVILCDRLGPGYTLIQNAEATSVFEPFIEQYGLTVEAAGALGKGERCWMLFRLPVTMQPVDGDDVRGYAVAVWGHNGTQAFILAPTPIRVVCQNTLNAAVGDQFNRSTKGLVFNIHHKRGAKAQVAQAGQLFENLLKTMETTGQTFADMAKRRLTPQELTRYIHSIFPDDQADDAQQPASDKQLEKRSILADLMFSGKGADLAMSQTDGTPNCWSAYNAVTEWVDHVVPAKAKSLAGAREKNTSALFGTGADLKLLALKQAQRLVAAN